MFTFKASSAAFALLLAIQAHAHAIITPDLTGGTARSDVTRPSTSAPCGAGVNIASLIDTATAIPVTGGAVDATITNFNAGVDGSRQVTAQIDPTGTGKSFQAATVTTNGDENPTDVGSQPLVVSVPATLKASGGATGNKMLIAFTTAGGFGNCVVATTGAASTGTAAGNSTTTTSTSSTGTGKTTTGSTGTGKTITGSGSTNTTTTGKTTGAGTGTGKAGTGSTNTTTTSTTGTGAAGKTKGKAGKKHHHKAKAGTAGAAGTAGGAQKKQRQIQKMKLRNAVYAIVDTN